MLISKQKFLQQTNKTFILKRNIYIYSPSSDKTSGGISALYNLYNFLNEKAINFNIHIFNYYIYSFKRVMKRETIKLATATLEPMLVPN